MLAADLTATHADGGVDLALTVTNDGDGDVTLSFRDAQRAEFVAEAADKSGAVWRYSDDRMFGMATGTVTLAPGDSETYEATWPNPATGEYRIRGLVVATDADASATTTVDVT